MSINPAPNTCQLSTEQNHLRSSRVGDVSRRIEGPFDTISLREITQGERRKTLGFKCQFNNIRILLAFLLLMLASACAHSPTSEPANSEQISSQAPLTDQAVSEKIAVASSSEKALRLSRKRFDVTYGRIDAGSEGRLLIEDPTIRAVTDAPTPGAARLRFTYLGPSKKERALASGQIRRQIGFKLLAQDTCNLLYVMRRIGPDSLLAVQVKRNPGKHTHAQCGAKGYTTLETFPVPLLNAGDSEELVVRIEDGVLIVIHNGEERIRTPLPPEALELKGPIGLRSDNGRFAAALEIVEP